MSWLRRFLAGQAASGIALFGATALALVLANTGWAHGLETLLDRGIGVTVADYWFERPLHFWVNDGLMTVFFLGVGLEIRREIYEGELQTIRRAALPLLAALGGMVVPAVIYLALNAGKAGAAGWAIPMATDIASALGVLALVGTRVPTALRVLLLGLAVIDDIGAIVVIALFYAGGLNAGWFLVAGLGVAGVLALRALDVRAPIVYVAPGLFVWLGLYFAGVHPTLAGVLLGLLAPVKGERAVAQHLGEALQPWIGLVIMPLFALANAGVSLANVDLAGDAAWVCIGVALGLLVGKTVGIAGAALLATRLGLATRSSATTPRGIVLVGLTGGVGFTMSLFIAQLAFPGGPLLEAAKLGILVGSAAAGVISVAFGRAALRERSQPEVHS